MKYVYLLKYEVNYNCHIKYKVFSTIENANNFHKNYKHHLIKDAYIEKYEILVMELDINLNNKELNKKIN
ncbi:hypothetical protein [Spiroplasma ixodetis]|uniref:hypothetical protein n=1 Tax=Spiroplasma ixodetis TaxID=2141 RepID=UPI0025791AF6|nr:hypothetical protein [Spiroplasma ixodetis]WJG70423.1 hypothetical protein SIXOD_v1c15730 [Spiroplasma ixodetis Y32]